MRGKGLFVCIEGLDKSGKTTQSHLLVEKLTSSGFKASYTTEPTKGEIGQFIRIHVLRRQRRVPVVVEALLFAMDRLDHAEREIKPMLEKNIILVSDRYVYSSLAYQGAANLGLWWISDINKFSPVPDLAIYIDVSPEILVGRIRGERSVMETLQVQRKVHNVYMRLVHEGKMISVNGDRPVEAVSRDILDLVLGKLGV